MLLRKFGLTIYLSSIYNRLISARATDRLLIFYPQHLTCSNSLRIFTYCQADTAAGQQIKSVIVEIAKEIISGEQGYTQQGGDLFSADSQLWCVDLLRIIAAAKTHLKFWIQSIYQILKAVIWGKYWCEMASQFISLMQRFYHKKSEVKTNADPLLKVFFHGKLVTVVGKDKGSDCG